MSIERTNIGYVGVIDDLFTMVATKDDPAYYIPILGDLNGATLLSFSRGAVGDLLNSQNVSYEQAFFTVVPSSTVENGWLISITNSTGVFKGYLTYGFFDEDQLINSQAGNVLTLTQYNPSTIILIPQQASGYGRGVPSDDGESTISLLAGIRYTMAIQGVNNIRVQITNDQPASGDLEGLYRGATYVEYYTPLTEMQFIMVPATPAAYISRTPPVMGKLNQAVGITQCATMVDTGYGDSQYCLNWEESQGFSTEDDVQDIIYFYSQDGTCGQAYTEGGIQVATSRGDCENNYSCEYSSSSESFNCRRDGILHQEWFWIALLLIFLLIVLIALAAVVMK